MHYDNPNFLIVRAESTIGAFSAAAAASEFAGTTLRVYTKAVVLGCAIQLASGGSASVNATIGIAARAADGTLLSQHQKFTIAVKATAACLNTIYDLSLTTPLTIASMAECAVLVLGDGTIADKGYVLNRVIWRYRILPKLTEIVDNK